MTYEVKNPRGLDNMIFLGRLKISLLGLMLAVFVVGSALQAYAGPPLLLSIDVEQVNDGEALDILNLRVPATYFVTGEFALQFPGVVKGLARRGTIGSHSHRHGRLTEMATVDVHLDLLNSSQAIEAATGFAPVWFRAPFLDVNENVLNIASDLGFKYDSSESERWLQQRILKEFPISRNTTDRILLSDFDIFITYGLDDQMALELLKENYVVRQKSDRPFIFLLHPSIISKHAEVLHQFIEFVSLSGGDCLSFDQYIQQMTAPSTARIAIKIDRKAATLDLETTIQDLLSLTVTDVYLPVVDDNGDSILEDETMGTDNDQQQNKNLYALLGRLKEEGIKVHASIPVLQNMAMAGSKPERAMVDSKGKASSEWLSTSHPQTSQHLKETINKVLKSQFDGVHLEYLYYPSLDYDYSLAELGRFRKDEEISFADEDAARVVPTDHYVNWVRWRSSQITNLAKTAADAISDSGRTIELSASLIAEALINFRYLEIYGQDYRELSEQLDMIATIPKSWTDLESNFSVPRIIASAHALIGSTTLMIGVPQREHQDSAEGENSALIDKFMDASYSGSGGVLLPSYQEIITDDYFSANGFEIIKKIIQQTKSSQKRDSSASNPALPLAFDDTALSSVKVDTPKKNDAQDVKKRSHLPSRSNDVLISSLLALTASILFIVLYVYVRDKVRKKEANPDLDKTVIIGWQNLDKMISRGEITGGIVHSVARQLRNYDPVDTSRYRVALLIDKVIREGKKLSVNNLIEADMNLPGWQVLAKSHINEALMRGFFTRNGDILEVTEQGELELVSMREKGFDPGHWIFVEQRLHENLLVNCPHCKAENVAHWYWTNFFCSSCGRDIMFKNCGAVLRTHHSSVGLDQHKYS